MPVDAPMYRHIMSHFTTGVTVLTMQHEGRARGTTANAFCAVSLDPPLVLVCIVNGGVTYNRLQQAGHFAINILHAGQRHLAERFAGRLSEDRDNFQDLPLRQGVTGAPIFADCLAYADCRVVAVHEAGDHTIFVGEMLGGDVLAELPPLAYYHRDYRDVLLDDPPVP